jgi:hypothetical protein
MKKNIDCKVMSKIFPIKGIEKKCKDAQKCIQKNCKSEFIQSEKMKKISSDILKKDCKKETKTKNIQKMVECITKKMKASDYKKISNSRIKLEACQMKKCHKELNSLGKNIASFFDKKS